MSKVQKVTARPFTDAKGRFLPGNKYGAMKPRRAKYMDEFVAAMRETEYKKRKSLFLHFLERAYKSDRVLVACIDRILPALKAIELSPGRESMPEEQAAKIRKRLKERFDADGTKKIDK